jgi:hypothetical protein
MIIVAFSNVILESKQKKIDLTTVENLQITKYQAFLFALQKNMKSTLLQL